MKNELAEGEVVDTTAVIESEEEKTEGEASIGSFESEETTANSPEIANEERDDVLIGEPNPAEVKRERKNALSAAVKDPVEEQSVDELAADEEPPVYDPASAKQDRKDALPSANVDPVEAKSEALVAVTTVHQSSDQYGITSIIKDAPDGAIVRCRDEKDMYAVFVAASKAGKDIKCVHKPNQESRMIWRIPG